MLCYMEFIAVRFPFPWLVILLLMPWRILLCLSQWYSKQMPSGHMYLEPAQVTALFLQPSDTVLKLMYIMPTEGITKDTQSHLLRPRGNWTSTECYGLQSEFAFSNEIPHHSIHSDEPLVDGNKRYCKTKVSVCRGKISQCMLVPYFFLCSVNPPISLKKESEEKDIIAVLYYV